MSGKLSRVAVVVATYMRPPGLERLLDSIARLHLGSVEIVVIVVDNDSEGSARGVCARSRVPVTYVVEPEPGIAHARNRGLSLAREHDAVAFVDDDEVVDQEWLISLIDTAEATNADVVSGPVIPELPPEAPKWVARHGWFARRRYRTGDPVRWPATNNALVRWSALDKLGGEYFDLTFSLTGGEDAELFWRLRRQGARFVWSDESLVYETVPIARANSRWIWRRGVRLGNVGGELALRTRGRVTVAAIGIARILVGALMLPLLFAGKNEHVATRIMNLPKGVGILKRVFGKRVYEYARSE